MTVERRKGESLTQFAKRAQAATEAKKKVPRDQDHERVFTPDAAEPNTAVQRDQDHERVAPPNPAVSVEISGKTQGTDRQPTIVERQVDAHLTSLRALGQQYQKALLDMRNVLSMLPEGVMKSNAVLFMDTSTLWVQQVFTEQEGRILNMLHTQAD